MKNAFCLNSWIAGPKRFKLAGNFQKQPYFKHKRTVKVPNGQLKFENVHFLEQPHSNGKSFLQIFDSSKFPATKLLSHYRPFRCTKVFSIGLPFGKYRRFFTHCLEILVLHQTLIDRDETTKLAEIFLTKEIKNKK